MLHSAWRPFYIAFTCQVLAWYCPQLHPPRKYSLDHAISSFAPLFSQTQHSHQVATTSYLALLRRPRILRTVRESGKPRCSTTATIGEPQRHKSCNCTKHRECKHTDIQTYLIQRASLASPKEGLRSAFGRGGPTTPLLHESLADKYTDETGQPPSRETQHSAQHAADISIGLRRMHARW